MKISTVLASAAAISMIGSAAMAATSGSANINIKGTVSPQCSLTGSSATINLTGMGPNQALTGSANVGSGFCNTANLVTVSKSNGSQGLKTDNFVAYDQAQFTGVLPYSVTASFQGVSVFGIGPHAATTENVTVGTGKSNSGLLNLFGAWNSPITLALNVPGQTLNLLAGNYSDTVTVTLATY